MSRLTGKIALVTGASKGIGAGIAKNLGAEGAVVVVHRYRNARFPIPILSQESKSALMSDLPSIVTAEPNFRVRLAESWPLRIDTAGIP